MGSLLVKIILDANSYNALTNANYAKDNLQSDIWQGHQGR